MTLDLALVSLTSKIQAKKKKIYSVPPQSSKLLCIKGHDQESEKTTLEWEKIFENHLSKKGVVSTIEFL